MTEIINCDICGSKIDISDSYICSKCNYVCCSDCMDGRACVECGPLKSIFSIVAIDSYEHKSIDRYVALYTDEEEAYKHLAAVSVEEMLSREYNKYDPDKPDDCDSTDYYLKEVNIYDSFKEF